MWKVGVAILRLVEEPLDQHVLDPSNARLSADRGSILVEDGDLPGNEPMMAWVP